MFTEAERHRINAAEVAIWEDGEIVGIIENSEVVHLPASPSAWS